MTKEEFQSAHGEQWAGITRNPAFFAAMQLVSVAKLQRIASVTDDEIEAHGRTILADFRGHLQMENSLIELAVAESVEPLFDLPQETYRDPLRQAPQPAGNGENKATQHIHFQHPQPPKSKTKRKSK